MIAIFQHGSLNPSACKRREQPEMFVLETGKCAIWPALLTATFSLY